MAIDIGPKIGIDGEKEFRKELNEINTTLRTLGTEMQKVSSEFKENGQGQEALRRKNEVLNKSIDEQRKKLEMVQKALKESEAKYGETATTTQKWQQVVNRTETALNDLESELKQNEKALQEMDAGLRDVETGLEKVDKSADGIKDLKADLADAAENGAMVLSGALVGLAGALAGAAESTREYRTDQTKLKVAFEDTGYSVEQAKEAYREIYGLLAEDDTSVEAANHLAELTRTEEELATWTGDILPGVFAKFGDSLPLEGLTEAANETAKVGTVTGSLADALNWAGINEDEFNEKLAKCSNEQERSQLITKTLADVYTDAGKSFKEANKEVIEANKAQADLTDSIADLGAAAEPVLTKLKKILTDLIKAVTDVVEEFNELPESTQDTILAIGGIGIATGPAIKGIKGITGGISTLGKGLKAFLGPAKTAKTAVETAGAASTAAATATGKFSTAFSGLSGVLAASPITLVATALGGLVTYLGFAAVEAANADNEFVKFNKEIRQSREEMNEYEDTMARLRESRSEAIQSSTSEFQYIESLKNELSGLVDANGRVTEGYEARAEFITGTLSEALGQEITVTDGVIDNYEALAGSIDDVIAKKKAEAYISAGDSEYQEALKQQQEVTERLIEAKEKQAKAEEDLAEAAESGSMRQQEAAHNLLMAANKNAEEAMEDYQENSEIIEKQEAMMTAFLEGNYQKVAEIAFNTEKNITEMTKSEAEKRLEEIRQNRATLVSLYEETGDETLKTMIDSLDQEETALNSHLSGLASDVRNNKSIPESMRDLVQRMKTPLTAANWKSLGGNVTEGVAQGIRQKKRLVINAMRTIASAIQDTFIGRLIIGSPSKWMEREAYFVPEGAAIGIKKGIPLVKEANEEMINAIGGFNPLSASANLTAPGFETSQTIDLTTYCYLDGKIVSKTVQKDITKQQSANIRAKGGSK